ncbi:PspC domain-containing protein [Sphingomonas sp.]|uniref:PspC domain-containing protein n=1 Tax=Sphingomonas sp. TaxID=28214 RepID=UPI0035BBC3F2
MHDQQPAPIAKKDNLFGICAALGEDFGFNPLYLRIALSVGILWNPLAMFGGYLALGLVVLATRLLCPDAKTSAATAEITHLDAARPVTTDAVELAKAA